MKAIVCSIVFVLTACGDDAPKEVSPTKAVADQSNEPSEVAKAAKRIIDEAEKQDPEPTVQALTQSFYSFIKDQAARKLDVKDVKIDEQRGLITFSVPDPSSRCLTGTPPSLPVTVHVLNAEIEPYDEVLRPFQGTVTYQIIKTIPNVNCSATNRRKEEKTDRDIALWGARSKKFTWKE